MASAKAPRVYLVYGNHGKTPAQLEDYHAYFLKAFFSLGYQALLSEDPVAGHLNVLIECFDEPFTAKVREAKKNPKTEFLVVATEFITNQTFNDFESDEANSALKSKALPSFLVIWGKRIFPILFPRFLRALALEYFHDGYVNLRTTYYELFGFPQLDYYLNREYWKKRFNFFNQIAPYCSAIWCVSPNQISEYSKRYGRQVKLMPIAAMNEVPTVSNFDQTPRDIDFLFTGSLTPYRAAIVERLRVKGYNVMIGTATWPAYMREHYIARTKICLQIRQSPTWKYPSVMRYHYLLSAGSVIVAEKASETCLQEQALIVADPKNFIAVCEAEIERGNFDLRGREACAKYYKLSAPDRKELFSLLNQDEPQVSEVSLSYN